MKNFIYGLAIGCLVTLIVSNIISKPLKPSGMGVIDLNIGCDDKYEFGVMNEELYDSIVIVINVDCNIRE